MSENHLLINHPEFGKKGWLDFTPITDVYDMGNVAVLSAGQGIEVPYNGDKVVSFGLAREHVVIATDAEKFFWVEVVGGNGVLAQGSLDRIKNGVGSSALHVAIFRKAHAAGRKAFDIQSALGDQFKKRSVMPLISEYPLTMPADYAHFDIACMRWGATMVVNARTTVPSEE
jgi:hypothetical protein